MTHADPSPSAAVERCVSCDAELATPFCPVCGERRAGDRAYSLGEFAHEALEAFLSFDGRAIRTFKALFTRPGELTAAYVRGVRLPYLTPLNVFLVANFVYFVWATAVGADMFATRLSLHRHGTPYAVAADRAVAARLAGTGEDSVAFAQRFDALGRTQAKSLVIVMVPAFAVLVALATIGGDRRHAVQHIAFAFQTYAFIFFVLLAAPYVIGVPAGWLLRLGHVALSAQGWDDLTSGAVAVAVIVYLALSLRRAYQFGLARASASAIALMVGVVMILSAYRGLLFLATFWSV